MAESASINCIRNIGIMAHIDAGKTTTTERILFYTGKTYKMGEVHEGTAVMDSMVQEQERGITISAAATTCHWKNTNINIIDTPGHVDFTIEVERSLRVLDGVVCVMCAVAGVEPQTETVWHQAERHGVARFIFVNKMDRTGADVQGVIKSINKRLGFDPLVMQLVIGSEAEFTGVIDLVEGCAYTWEMASNGEIFEKSEIPAAFQNEYDEAKDKLIATLADHDDAICDAYLEGEDISKQTLKKVIKRLCVERKVVPLFCGSAFKNKGVQLILDAIVDYLPSPAEVAPAKGLMKKTAKEIGGNIVEILPTADNLFVALAFKVAVDSFYGQLVFLRIYAGKLKVGDQVLNVNENKKEKISRIVQLHSNQKKDIKTAGVGDIVAIIGTKFSKTGDTLAALGNQVILDTVEIPKPVMRVAVEAITKSDESSLEDALAKMAREDPSFQYYEDPQTGQNLISGMGELHLEIIVDRIKREYKVACNVGKPYVNYRESISASATKEFEYIRETESKKQYAFLKIELRPNERDAGFTFEDKSGKKVPVEIAEAIRLGVQESLFVGVLAAFPVVDVGVRVKDIRIDEEASSPVAFRIAAAMLFKECCRIASPILLEPVMKTDIIVQEDFVGEIINDANKRRGTILNMSDRSGARVVTATIPLSEMFGYSTALRSKTQGRGTFSMEFCGNREVPNDVQSKILNNSFY